MREHQSGRIKLVPQRVIFRLSIGLSGLSGLAAAVAWSIPSLIAPRGGTATGGIMNLLNNMFGVVAPITTGYIVGAQHSFTGAFLLPASWRVFGILGYVFIFILGRLEPIAIRRPRDVSTPIRSRVAKENVRPAAAPVTVDTIVARREERTRRQEPR
jgi:MFS family permease